MSQGSGPANTLAKQFAIGFGIVALLPLAVWYGVALFHPPPDRYEYFPEEKEMMYGVPPHVGEAPQQPNQQENKQRRERYEEALRLYYRDLFFVGYPVGMLSMIIGRLMPVQAVGAGLMFAGLATLSMACYCYWDKLGDVMRFGSLLGALALVLLLGLWRGQNKNTTKISAT